MSSSAELKASGNKAFSSKDYKSAIDLYTQAIEAAKDPKADAVHVLYSNRSACHAGLRDWESALKDAEKTIELDPSFSKGYGRKGAALHGARKLEEAIKTYEQGLELAPGDKALEKGKEDVQRAIDSASRGGDDGLGKMFSDPQLFSKLAANPKTAPLLADPSFMAKLKQIQSNPNDVMGAMSDPRMIQVMGALMGIDMQAFERPEGSNDLPSDLEKNREEIEKQTNAAASSSSPSSKPQPSQTKKEEPTTKDVEMEDANDDDEEAKAKKQAEEEKKLGNSSYLKKEFDTAIPHYEKAWEIYPKDITYLNNLGACHFEKGDYDSAIKTCEKAVEEGRALRADYKLVAKAFGRIGSAYLKKDDLEKAILNFEKSLTEHRTPDILTKLRDTEKEQKERIKRAYIDPAKSDEERNKGNDLYKKGDYPGSVAAYTESIKRNPNDPRGYTNRASAYTKLAALPEALKDCEEAIKVDPKYIKAYIRKSNVQFSMKDYSKALEACQRAADLDDEISTNGPGKGPNAREIASQQQKCFSAMYSERSGETDEQILQRAMRDPEVAKIMQDPVMQSILQQAQSNPAALQDHMKNPQIREKVQKLIAAGIIKTR